MRTRGAGGWGGWEIQREHYIRAGLLLKSPQPRPRNFNLIRKPSTSAIHLLLLSQAHLQAAGAKLEPTELEWVPIFCTMPRHQPQEECILPQPHGLVWARLPGNIDAVASGLRSLIPSSGRVSASGRRKFGFSAGPSLPSLYPQKGSWGFGSVLHQKHTGVPTLFGP